MLKTRIEDQNLIFTDDAIIVENDKLQNLHAGIEVMMEWETGLMRRHAELACENGGDILEIGFGMGISANFIQELNPDSHTIVESHPQIIEKLKEWAADKPSVIIVEGRWLDVIDQLGVYDGVFYDTFGDDDYSKFGTESVKFTKPGSIITAWNAVSQPNQNLYGFTDNVTYEEIDVAPPDNGYFFGNKYYLFKVVV